MSSSNGTTTTASNSLSINGTGSTYGDVSDDDEYYMEQMALILDAFPKTGPPGHPCRVSGHVYIGNQENADDLDLLPALGITHVLNMAGTRNFDVTRSPYKPSVGIKSFLMVQAEDYDEYDIASHFPDAIAFLDRARASGGNALVHCNLGVNRSGAIVAAYLMVSEQKTLLKVATELKAKRSLIIANVGFRRQLVRYARCRGYLDPVERKPPPSPSLSTHRKKAVLEDIAKIAKAEKSAPPRSDGRVSLLNGEPKKNGYHREDDDDDVGADQFSIASAASLVNEASASADALQRYFKTKTENGTGNTGRYTTANVGDLVSAVRRERLLNDVDAAIKMSRDDCDDVSDSSSSNNNFEITTKATSGGRATNGYHRVESAGLLTDDYGVSDRSRAVFEIDRSSVSGSSGFRCPTSSDRLSATNYYNRLDTSSVSNYSLPSRSSLSPSVQLVASASAPRLHGSLTNGDVHFSSPDWLTASSGGSSLGRPLSAHSLNTANASYLIESELPTRVYSRPRIGGGASRRNRDDDDDGEVISFLAEADRRAQMNGACVSRVRNTVATAARLESERRCSVPESLRSSSLLSTDDVNSWRPRRSYVGGASTVMAPPIGGGSSAIGHHRYTRTSSTPRLTTSRLLSEMTDELVLDDISDYGDDFTSRRQTMCGRIVPTRVTASPSLRISSGSYLHI